MPTDSRDGPARYSPRLRPLMRKVQIDDEIFAAGPQRYEADHGETNESCSGHPVTFKVASHLTTATDPVKALSTIHRFDRISRPAMVDRFTISGS